VIRKRRNGLQVPALGAQHPLTAAVRDAPQFLDVQADQLARMLTLVAHGDPAGPVSMGQAAHPVAGQHPIEDGGAGHPQVVAEPVRALAAAPAGSQHPTHLAGCQRVRAALGPGSCDRPGRLGLRHGGGQAICGRSIATPQALGGQRGRPAQLGDALHQQQPTELGQAALAWAMRVPLPARCFDNPSRSRGPSTVIPSRELQLARGCRLPRKASAPC
jgi:hypothetical protein